MANKLDKIREKLKDVGKGMLHHPPDGVDKGSPADDVHTGIQHATPKIPPDDAALVDFGNRLAEGASHEDAQVRLKEIEVSVKRREQYLEDEIREVEAFGGQRKRDVKVEEMQKPGEERSGS